MPTWTELHAEYKLLFPECIDGCFCEHCNINDCLFCYLDLADEWDEAEGWDEHTTVREPPLAAMQSVAAYVAWAQALPPRTYLQSFPARSLGITKALLEADPLFYGKS